MSTMLLRELISFINGGICSIGERIYKYLEEKGMSQAEFVSRTGISQSTVSDWKIKKA